MVIKCCLILKGVSLEIYRHPHYMITRRYYFPLKHDTLICQFCTSFYRSLCFGREVMYSAAFFSSLDVQKSEKSLNQDTSVWHDLHFLRWSNWYLSTRLYDSLHCRWVESKVKNIDITYWYHRWDFHNANQPCYPLASINHRLTPWCPNLTSTQSFKDNCVEYLRVEIWYAPSWISVVSVTISLVSPLCVPVGRG